MKNNVPNTLDDLTYVCLAYIKYTCGYSAAHFLAKIKKKDAQRFGR